MEDLFRDDEETQDDELFITLSELLLHIVALSRLITIELKHSILNNIKTKYSLVDMYNENDINMVNVFKACEKIRSELLNVYISFINIFESIVKITDFVSNVLNLSSYDLSYPVYIKSVDDIKETSDLTKLIIKLMNSEKVLLNENIKGSKRQAIYDSEEFYVNSLHLDFYKATKALLDKDKKNFKSVKKNVKVLQKRIKELSKVIKKSDQYSNDTIRRNCTKPIDKIKKGLKRIVNYNLEKNMDKITKYVVKELSNQRKQINNTNFQECNICCLAYKREKFTSWNCRCNKDRSCCSNCFKMINKCPYCRDSI